MPEQRGGATDDGGGHRVVSLCCCGVLGGDVGSGKRRGKCMFNQGFIQSGGGGALGFLPPQPVLPPEFTKINTVIMTEVTGAVYFNPVEQLHSARVLFSETLILDCVSFGINILPSFSKSLMKGKLLHATGCFLPSIEHRNAINVIILSGKTTPKMA